MSKYIHRFKKNFINYYPTILLFLSILSVRKEVAILINYFTLSSFYFAILNNPVQFYIIFTSPILYKINNKN